MSEIDLLEILRLLLRKWWILFLGVAIFGTGAYIWTNHYTVPIYSSNTTLYIGKNIDQVGIQNNDLFLGSNLILDYREIAKSKLVANKVKNELGLKNISAGSIAGRIQVTQKNETRVIQISVTDTDPVMAMQLTAKVADVFKSTIKEIMQVENVQIIDKAEVQYYPISPDKNRNYLTGIMMGLVIAIAIVFITGFADNTIKTADDIRKYLDLPVIGSIPLYDTKKGR